MVPIRDEQRLVRQPCPDRHVGGDRPAAVGDALLVDELGIRRGRRHVVQQVAERRAGSAHRSVDGGEVGVGGSEQPEAILDRSRHGLLVRQDVASPVLELHRAEHAADPLGDARSHLVRLERERRPNEDASFDPAAQQIAGSRVRVPVSGSRIDLCDVERLRPVLPPE
jgi:hypothetical protein